MSKTLMLGLLAGLCLDSPASAERLYTAWRLKPADGKLPVDAAYGEPFLEQLLLPARAATLSADVRVNGKTVASSGSPLFLVYNDRRQVGFCPRKDFSASNQLKTLFVPILDRRPCFADRNADGRFDAIFYVFDKFGSGASPSGDLAKARPLSVETSYQALEPEDFPSPPRVSFGLKGSEKPDKAGIHIRFDKSGAGAWADWVGTLPRTANLIQVMNARVAVASVQDRRAKIQVQLDPDIYLIGTGDGFSASPLPPFILEYQLRNGR